MTRGTHEPSDAPRESPHGRTPRIRTGSGGIERIDDLVYASPGGRSLLADLYLPAEGSARGR